MNQVQPKQVQVLKTDRQVGTIRFSPCGRYLVAGGTDGRIHRWEASAPDWPELSPLEGHGGWIQALAFDPEGGRLYSADSWGRLACWAYESERPPRLWSVEDAHRGWIRGLAVHPDGARLATCSADRTVRLWSAEDGGRLGAFDDHGEDVFAVAFHPDGESLVSGDLKGVVKHRHLTGGRVVRELDARSLHRLDRLQDVGGVRVLAFDPSGKLLACAGTRPKNGGNVQGTPTALLFDWETGQPRQTWKIGGDGDGFVFDLLWHPDGSAIAVTSGNPGTGKLVVLRPGEESPTFQATSMPNCHALTRHPDGRRLAVAATNANSNGNGRQIGKGKDYPGNWSPLHLWELPADWSRSE